MNQFLNDDKEITEVSVCTPKKALLL